MFAFCLVKKCVCLCYPYRLYRYHHQHHYLSIIDYVLAKGGGGHHRKGDHHGDHDRPHRDHRMCPLPVTLPELNMQCTVTDDCRTITCSMIAEGEKAILTLKIKDSAQPMSADISLKVPSRGFEWSHTFTNGEKIKLPEIPLKIKHLASAEVYLMMKMYKMDKDIAFKVKKKQQTTKRHSLFCEEV